MKVVLWLMPALLLIAGMFCLKAEKAAAEPAAELFQPTSYEQYLPLEHPSDVAINASHIVIADGSDLFIYDRDRVLWRRYEHKPYGEEPRTITKVGFTDDGRLFFSDQDTHLFLYNFTTDEAQIQSNISCATFVIDKDTLYTTAVAEGKTTFYAFPHKGAGLSNERRRIIGDLSTPTSIAPHMFVKDGVLYCAVNSMVYIYRESGAGYESSWKQLAGEEIVQDLTSVAVSDGNIYYTVNGAEGGHGGLFYTELTTGSTCLLEGTGFNALTTYDGKLYCVKDASVRELNVTAESAEYTGYEIAAESDSYNRLSGAGDTVRAKDLIVTADCGNERVSVYNKATEQFTLLETGAAACVATDGEVIAAGVGARVLLYHYGETQPYYEHISTSAIRGVAVVFGRCYYVTDHHLYGVAEEGNREFPRINSPTALTCDVYGNLYVADQQNRVLRYTEAQFLDETVEDGEVVTEGWSLPAGFRCLRADFDGNLYYLYENAIYRNGDRLTTTSAQNVVYCGDRDTPDLVSFALGFEDNGLYLQYGSFCVLTSSVAFPSLSTIASGDAHEEIFVPADEESLRFVDVTAGASGICVDLLGLNEENVYFPYERYYRTEGGRGIKLLERGKFSLVALYENYGYTLALYRTEDCTEAPLTWQRLSPALRFTTSEIALSYYPCLNEALTAERLPRASQLTLLAQVQTEGSFSFGYVTSGKTAGFVPLGYLTEAPPLSALPDVFTLGYLKASEEGVNFRSEEGTSLLVTERTQVKIYPGGQGLYFVRFTQDGVEYTAQVPERMIQVGDPNALRMSLIIVLSVVAVGILSAYILFRPRKKKS